MSHTGHMHTDPRGGAMSSSRRPVPAEQTTTAAAAPLPRVDAPVLARNNPTRNSSTPVDEAARALMSAAPTMAAAAAPVETTNRWGEIMYPSASRLQRISSVIEEGRGAEAARSSSGLTPPPAQGVCGSPHTLASVPLHVTVGEDSELQELATAARQRVLPAHPHPSSLTVGIAGRHDYVAGGGRGSAASGTPNGAGSGTPLSGRPGSGTRHQHNPYDSVSPTKVLTPVPRGVSPPQPVSFPPAGGAGCAASQRYQDPHAAHSALDTVHSGAGRAGGLMERGVPYASWQSTGATSPGVGAGAPRWPAGVRGQVVDVRGRPQGWSHGSVAPTTAMASAVTHSSVGTAGSGLVPLPNFQPPPPFFGAQGVQGDRTALYEARRESSGGFQTSAPLTTSTQQPPPVSLDAGTYAAGNSGGWGAGALRMGFDSAPTAVPVAPTASSSAPYTAHMYHAGSVQPNVSQTRAYNGNSSGHSHTRFGGSHGNSAGLSSQPPPSSVPSAMNQSGTSYSGTYQGAMPSARRTAITTTTATATATTTGSTSYGDVSSGTSPPPPASNSPDESTSDRRVPGVLFPPLSDVVANEIMRYVEDEEPHLHYPLVTLPKSRINAGDTDERQRRIDQRRKQIQYGRETDGYLHYRAVIPEVGLREFHNANHPITPRPEYDCSKRTFDKFLNEWRRRLHHWDECDPSHPQPSFLPLGAVTLAELKLAPAPASHASACPDTAAAAAPYQGSQEPPPNARTRVPQTGPIASVADPSSGGGGGVGGMLSIATHATAAMGLKNTSPLRDGVGTGLTPMASFRNNPYGASARSGIDGSPNARGNGGSPGSAMLNNNSASFVLMPSTNGRTSTCTPSQGPKVDSTFFSSSSRAGSPAVNNTTSHGNGNPMGATALSGSGLFQLGFTNSGHCNFVSVTDTASGGDSVVGLRGGGMPRGSGRAFQRSNSFHNTQGVPHSAQGGGGIATLTAHNNSGWVAGGAGLASGSNEPSHHATPFHHDRSTWAGGAPHTPHHNNVLNGPRLFDFDTLNSPVMGSGMSGGVGGGGFTPQQSAYRTQGMSQIQPHAYVPSAPPVPSFSTPTSSPHGSGPHPINVHSTSGNH